MKRYVMEDRSGGKVNRRDKMLSLQQALEITDYTESEVDKISELEVGQEFLIGSDQDIYIRRTR